ncbi:MAG: uracil-DNA glycosylase [Spirochaetes bacterium]|nr:MAG: uracil-DNA glycosylase [Spirochaetota bacterium]
MKNYKKTFWNILNLIEDYERYGFEDVHPEAEFNEEKKKSREELLSDISTEVKKCTLCVLSKNRKNPVPGEGILDPLVMIIGEGPGAEEDRTGKPFIGRAGKYLDKWLEAIKLSRNENCFIGNIVKCRPPNNRDPKPEESFACFPYLERQIDILKPKVILTVGRISSQIMTGRSLGIGALRGKIYRYKDTPLVTTYHPSGVLRNPALRPRVWDDLRLLRTVIDERM